MKKIKTLKKRLFAFFRQRPYLRKAIYISLAAAAAILVMVAVYILSSPLTIAASAGRQRVDLPVELVISKRISKIELDAVTISPQIKGSWRYEAGSLTNEDRLVFQPKDALVVDTSYTVTLPELTLRFGGEQKPDPIVFMTEHAPGLSESVGLSRLTDGATIAADYVPTVALTSQNRQLRDLELRTEASVQTKLAIADDKQYSWPVQGYLPQGQTITFELYDRKNEVTLLKRTLAVAVEPVVQAAVKATYFAKTDEAIIEFNQPIDPASKKYIEFSLAGEGTWRDAKTYVFTPTAVEPGQTYTYTIKQGLRSSDGGIAVSDKTFQFQTTGSVSASVSPSGNGLSQAKQVIRFAFNQPVDHRSVEQRLGVSSGRVVGTSWSGNTFIVEVADLGYQRTVTATIGAGVVNAGFGLPSARAYSAQFTTEVRASRLNVPYYAQQQASTCTAAALRMALAYRGVGSSEMELVQKMGYNPRDMNRDVEPHIWDDPAEMFVGYANGGTIFNGAGPDAPPVAKAARASGRSATAVQGISAGWIAEQVYAGNPVIMFGATKNAAIETWQTPAGKTVRMNTASHVSVVTGVKGESDNPLGFWVNDPLYGASYWSTAQVQANIARDVYRQAVVVY